AVVGVVRLNSKASLALLVRALNDTSSRVRAAAIRCLVKLRDPGTHDFLRPLLDSEGVGVAGALRVMVEISSWESLRDVLYVLASGNSGKADAGWRALENWVGKYCNNLFTKPNTRLTEELATF